MYDEIVFEHHPALYFAAAAVVLTILAVLIWLWKPKETAPLRPTLSRLKWFMFRQKYRFDLGFQFLALVNFVLLVITATSALRSYIDLPSTKIVVSIAVPLAFLGVWLFGTFLDKVVRYQQALVIEMQKRNPVGDEMFAFLNRIEQKLDRLGG